MSKKIWSVLIVGIILLIPFLGYELWYVPNYASEDYYTFVGDSYQEVIEKDDSGNDYRAYYYRQKSYDKDGNEKLLKFNSAIGRPIKPDNFIKVTYNKKRDLVLSWEKVQKNEVPTKSLDALDE
ncbi:YxeA family protein [Companilactobacillus futsaii]|uniref:YxeA family protein n=2 Tax=Companilactobacillus futsaii TaxID=938155 RepID=A0A5B7SXI4_9LACO|nr:YxeA family protein [Companilactobacillus futsaii]KRK90550.1 hypothetical protein FC88_GL001807 [Companilactobacillus futsaii JCM 17355]QCX24616.1 YxeA family protein [Companilactobacillus futsaii]